jgi:DNA-directed RNA polymerase specialized sigma24 family protein
VAFFSINPNTMQQKYQAQNKLPDLVNSNSADGFIFLYNINAAPLLGVICKIVVEKTVAEEVLQQVFIKIQNQDPVYNPISFSILTWMLGIAIQTALENVEDRESSIDLLKQEIRKHIKTAAINPGVTHQHQNILCTAIK